ncbi:uncharacterized protein [Salminus brasiliensis]|uniref:uncharacterized protein isoform X2 n=1 Tax=Salminus brasiliensis TaxID=930266 RepID=UPI003B832552
MEVQQGLLVLLTALLTSPQGSVFCAQKLLHITPEDPLVKLGSSLTINCSTSCSSATPTWNIMKDGAAAAATGHGDYSTMEIHHVTIDDTAFTCSVKCGQKPSHATVKLYPFSDLIISTDPAEPETGRPFRLKCVVDVDRRVSAELKLKRGGTVLVSGTVCGGDDALLHCEVSAEEVSEASEALYECEATLRVQSSQRTEHTALALKLREPVTSTAPPAPSTAPPAPSTVAVVTEKVTIQTEGWNTQSSTKESTSAPSAPPSTAPPSTAPPALSTAPPAPSTALSTAPPAPSTAAVVTERVTVQTEGRNTQSSTKGQSSTTIWVVISLVILVVLVILVILICCCKKHKEKPLQEEHPLQ